MRNLNSEYFCFLEEYQGLLKFPSLCEQIQAATLQKGVKESESGFNLLSGKITLL